MQLMVSLQDTILKGLRGSTDSFIEGFQGGDNEQQPVTLYQFDIYVHLVRFGAFELLDHSDLIPCSSKPASFSEAAQWACTSTSVIGDSGENSAESGCHHSSSEVHPARARAVEPSCLILALSGIRK